MSEQFLLNFGIYAELNGWKKGKSGYIWLYLTEDANVVSTGDKKGSFHELSRCEK